jgi:phospholipid/cholesterol/gamma-HCH transport system substrate-binding protein
MNKEINNSIRLGVFVVIGMMMLIVGLYFIGSNKNIFGNTFRLYSTFREVGGLQSGNNVRYSGIDVGSINKIEIKNDTTISVEMVLEKKVAAFVRINSIATVGTDGLMGNKLINIEPGTSDSPFAKDGDMIPSREGVNTDAMLRTLDFTNQNIATVSSNIRSITENINKSKGTLYTILMDTTLATGFHHTILNIEEVTNNLTSFSRQLSDLISEVKQGKGPVGTLLNDTIMKDDLQAIVSEVKKSSTQFSVMTNNLTEIITKMNNGNGTFATIVNDTAMAASMKQSMINIQSASQKLDEDLEAIKHNFLLRGYFEKQEQEMIKSQKKKKSQNQ